MCEADQQYRMFSSLPSRPIHYQSRGRQVSMKVKRKVRNFTQWGIEKGHG